MIMKQYDQLEAYATRSVVLKVFIKEDEETLEKTTRIIDFHTKDKEEFATLEDGTVVRLDHLIIQQTIED